MARRNKVLGARRTDARARLVVTCALVLACTCELRRVHATWYTADGRRCLDRFDVGGDGRTVVSACVPYRDTGVMWCRAEDGFWGACAENVEAAVDVAEPNAIRRAAKTLGDPQATNAGKREAMELLDVTSTLVLRVLADEQFEIDGVVTENPLKTYLAARNQPLSAPSPPPSPPPPPPLPPPPSPPPPSSRCVARTNVRWQSPQADGSYEFGMDVYVVLTSGADISNGWEILFKFSSPDVMLYSNSAYGASASIAYDSSGERMFRLRDRGYDGALTLYSTRRIGFNTRARARRALDLSYIQINGEVCDIARAQ